MLMRRMNCTGAKIEIREDGQKVIVGYGAVFYREGDLGSEYWLWSDLVERISPGAFQRAIKDRDDARGLFNHDPNMLLGRVGAGTMRLSEDHVGLRYEIDVPDTTVGRDVVASINRGDLSGSSFAFSIDQYSWTETPDYAIRNIKSVKLYDTGPVTYPAYQSTTAGVRGATMPVEHGEQPPPELIAWRNRRAANRRAGAEALLEIYRRTEKTA